MGPDGALVEHRFRCPYCGEVISMILDATAGRQSYVEDCEVCCNPIDLRFSIEDAGVVDFRAVPSQ